MDRRGITMQSFSFNQDLSRAINTVSTAVKLDAGGWNGRYLGRPVADAREKLSGILDRVADVLKIGRDKVPVGSDIYVRELADTFDKLMEHEDVISLDREKVEKIATMLRHEGPPSDGDRDELLKALRDLREVVNRHSKPGPSDPDGPTGF